MRRWWVGGLVIAVLVGALWFALASGDRAEETNGSGSAVRSIASQRRGDAVPAIEVHGVVRDRDGVIAGARVCAISTRTPSNGSCVETSGAGTYQLAIDAGSYSVSAGAPGHAGSMRTIELPISTSVDFDLLLAKQMVAEGIVVDSGGGPVVGARVSGMDESPPVLTDAQGRFRIATTNVWDTAVATADGYAEAVQNFVAPVTDIRIVMLPEVVITGHVVTSSGAAVPGADVMIEELGYSRVAATTRGDGTFELHQLGPGQYLVSAASDHAFGQAELLAPLIAGQRADVRILVRSAANLIARLEHDGHPCPDGSISLDDERTVKAHDGNAVIAGVYPGQHDISVDCGKNLHSDDRTRKVMIGAHDVAKTWTFHLEDVVVKGRIVDARGVPVVGAKVRLQLGGVATSDHEGHYELAGLARARYWLTVEADGYAQTSESLDLERDVTTRDIEMNDGCTIDGMVVDDRDRPQANIAILVNLRGQKSDAGGRFHLEHERCRNVGVSVADDSGTFQMFNFVEGQLGKIRLVVPPRDRTIRGRVVDPSGLPAGDGTVYVGKEQSESVSARIQVNADGTFVVDHLADGLYEVTASRDDYPSATVAHVKTGSSVTVQFASGLTLHGVARDESGRPLPDFSVGFGAEKYKQNHFHNADGRFRIDALEPGTYTLHLAVGDEHGLAEVHLDERHQDFEVVLDTSVTVVGLVQTTDHRPAADVTVHVRHVWTKTDTTGHFEVPRLSRGQLSIQLGGWDGQTVERDASNPGVIDLGMITLDPPK